MNDFLMYADAKARLADVRCAAVAARRGRRARRAVDVSLLVVRRYTRPVGTAACACRQD